VNEAAFIACEHCHAEGEVLLPACGALGPLVCPHCHRLLTMISVAPWRSHIEQRVAQFAERHRTGQLGTRRQSRQKSDTTIDRDGREAELAACLLLCPGYRQRWFETDGPNRGNDLPAACTLLPQPVEVKQTRYCDSRRGYLLVRPPRQTPGPMRTEYIDDCLYVLMHGQDCLYTLLGWADRSLLLSSGEMNPVPLRPGQRECWGIHWSHLHPTEALAHDRHQDPTAFPPEPGFRS